MKHSKVTGGLLWPQAPLQRCVWQSQWFAHVVFVVIMQLLQVRRLQQLHFHQLQLLQFQNFSDLLFMGNLLNELEIISMTSRRPMSLAVV
jgi:hypothetical protein